MASSPAPWSLASLRVLDGDVGFPVEVIVYGNDLDHPLSNTAAELVSGSLTLDESWAPYVQGSLRVRFADGAALGNLDARYFPSVLLRPGYRHPDGTLDQPVTSWVIGVGDCAYQYGDGTWALDLVSAEDRMQRARHWPAAAATTTYASYSAAISNFLTRGLTSPAPVINSTLTGTGTSMTSYRIAPGDSLWEHLESVRDMANARVRCDLDGQWYITPAPSGDTIDTGTPLTIATGDAPTDPQHFTPGDGTGTVVRGVLVDPDPTRRTSRDEWANTVTIYHEWRDSAGTTQTIAGRAPTGTLTGQRVVEHFTRTTPTTQTEANNACAAMLTPLIRRGKQIEVATRAFWWLRPGDTIRLWVNGTWDYWIIRRLTWDLAAGTMTLTLREPIT